MTIGVRNDPVLGYNFLITFVDTSSVLGTLAAGIQNAVLGGFSECSGLESSLQVEEYKEGGRNGGTLKFPTRVTWGNITFKRGLTIDASLWNWYFGFVQGRGRRKDGLIVLQNDERMPISVWQFKRGLPVKWTGPTLNAAQNAVAVESLEIAHEGLILASAAPDLADVFGG